MHKSYLSHWEEGSVGTMCRWTVKRPSYAICVENHIYISYLWLNITYAHASYTWPANLHICSFHKFSGNSSLPSSLPICTFAVFTSLVGTPSLPYNPYTSILLNTRWFYTMTITLNVVGGKLPRPIVDTAASYWGGSDQEMRLKCLLLRLLTNSNYTHTYACVVLDYCYHTSN